MNTIKVEAKGTKFVAHRGVSGIERENTAPAFVAAGNRGYFGIECDVHVTADRKFVVIHDETTKRVTNGRIDINVEKSVWDDIKNVVLPDMDGTTVRKDIRIPSLAEYVKICKKYEKRCVIELKNPFIRNDVERFVEEIKALDYLDGITFIAFSLENCMILRDLLPDAHIQFLACGPIDDNIINILEKYKFDIDIGQKTLTKEGIDRVHAIGQKVNCWTVDDKARAEELIAMGVDYITTNILEGV
ncbi:MAG: glycerophosphodiester phosphodiesterase [Clostridia bacterium]|nr:glycerophosphodiester phosphodiesterase [Clostridia bacterium]